MFIQERIKISMGIGFRRSPELVVLSPLSLPQSLILELDRLCFSSSSGSVTGVVAVGVGLLSPSFGKLGRPFLCVLFSFSFSGFFGETRLNRSIHDEAECGTWV